MEEILFCISFFIVFTLLLIFYLWMSELISLRQTMSYIPGPPNFPFVGLSWKISKIPHVDRFNWLNDLCFLFKNGIVVTWFGIEPIVNIRKPRQIQVMLERSVFISKSKSYSIIVPWLKNGVFLISEAAWYNHRYFMEPSFKIDAIEDYATVARKNVKTLMECIDIKINQNSNASINIYDLVNKYTFDTFSEIAVGVNGGTQQNVDNVYATAFYNCCQITADRQFGYWIKWDFIFHLTKKGITFLNELRKMRSFTEMMIKEKIRQRSVKKLRSDIETKPEAHRRKLFIDFLIDATECTEYPLTIEEVQQEIDTFIFLGHNTTSAAISWTLFLLGNAQKIQNKVHKEILRFFGTYEPSCFIQLNQLQYLDRVVKEALRIYPSIPIIGRCLDNDAVIDNYYIPEGTTVNIQIFQLHHDPEVWKDPEIFNPDRFLPENGDERHPFAYIPFSAGPRNCLAEKFAMLMIKYTLMTILRKWRVKSVLKQTEMKLTSNVTLKPYNNRIDLYFTPIDDI